MWSAGPPLLPAVVEGVTSLSPNSAASLTQLPTARLPVEENNGASLCAASCSSYLYVLSAHTSLTHVLVGGSHSMVACSGAVLNLCLAFSRESNSDYVIL